MTRMFIIDGKPMRTWNCFVGCNFGCTYCSARKLALGRLKNSPRYRDGFKPHLVREELRRHFRPGEWVFIAYMGDIAWCEEEDLRAIMGRVRLFPDTKFLMMTKDPHHYLWWQQLWGFEPPPHLYLGTTIETNIDYNLSQAPPPVWRYEAMAQLQHPHKFVSLEPLMDFHLATLVGWIKEIGPEIIEVGADNYHNSLPEPYGAVPAQKAPWKVRWLLEELRQICPTVVEKRGLERLTGIS